MELIATKREKQWILTWKGCDRSTWLEILDWVRDLPGRKWLPDEPGKPWAVRDSEEVRTLLEEFGFVGEGLNPKAKEEKESRPKPPPPWKDLVLPMEFPGVRPYQLDYLRFMEHSNLRGGNGDEMGTGKACPLTEPILTPAGWTTHGEIQAGDFVISADGEPTEVLGVFPQGVLDVYSLTFSDGVSVRCSSEHLWDVRDYNRKYRGGGWSTKTTKSLIESGLLYKNGTSKWEIPAFSGQKTQGKELLIDPWLLGALVGNGSLSSGAYVSVTFDSRDSDLVSRTLGLGANRVNRTSTTHCPELSFRGELLVRLKKTLSSYGLLVKSKEKRLPPEVFVAPWEQRVELLRGLMDSDGSNRKNRIHYHTCSPHLGEDVAMLVRSLGGDAVVTMSDRTSEGKPVEWDVNVKTQFCPFSSARKSKGWKADWRMRGNRIEKIERVADADCVCIMVDHPRHLYVTTGYKLTHNTVQACSLLKLHPELLPAVIVVTASTKIQWKREVRKWVSQNAHVYILQGKKPQRLSDPKGIYIINWDILDSWLPAFTAMEPQVLIGDEIQKIGGHTSLRSKAFRKISHMGTTRAVTVLSGTPIDTRPDQYWPLMDVLSPGLFPDQEKFLKRYFPYQWVKGELVRKAKHQEELHELTKHLWIRRLKSEVLPDLPEKTYCPIEMECSPDSAYDEALKKIMAVQGLSDEELQRRLQSLTLSAFHVKRQAVLDWISEFATTTDRKLIIFAWHRAVLDVLQQALGQTCVRVDGGVTGTARDNAVSSFQKDPSKRFFLGNIEAAGVGLDGLQNVCGDVLYVEFSWSPSKMAQSEDRVHRIGQLNPCNIWYAIAPDTIDEAFFQSLTTRRGDISRIVDGDRSGADDLKAVLQFIKKR